MSYRVNPTSLLFDDLTPPEIAELETLTKQLVLEGRSIFGQRCFIEWCNVAGFDDRQALLVMTTAFPQRALLSLVHYYKPFAYGKLTQ